MNNQKHEPFRATDAKGSAEAEPKGKRADKAQREPEKLSSKAYEKQLQKLQVELCYLQDWVRETGARVVIICEGRDTAGKGGLIKRMTERVSPRTFRVVALSAPNEHEQKRLFLQRYVQHLPSAGEVVIFDRSWYNRAGVERVMGFTDEDHVREFLAAVPMVETAIVKSGVQLLKYWLEVSEEEQTKRLKDRAEDGRKLWKLSPMDMKSYSRWYDYSRARDEMFEATDTGQAPWFVARTDDKRRGRLNIIRHVLDHVHYEELPREKIKFPKRQKAKGYVEPKYPYKYVEERY